MKKKLILILIAMSIVIGGCSGETKQNGSLSQPETTTTDKAIIVEIDEVAEPEINYELVKPNEMGKIMVLMYHGIDEKEKQFVRTPENFRMDLETLYDLGYRPISIDDYIEGNIDIEAGMSPVVFTFDDGLQNQFNVYENENGEIEIDPDCAVGILAEFNKEHPDFPLEATFFINANPFRQPDYLEFKINYLIENGMDIGNHTKGHINLKDVKDKDKIADNMSYIKELVNEYAPDYEVDILSLPFGAKPETEELRQHAIQDENKRYFNKVFLEVGWDPYLSPYHKDFNTYGIHRVRASDLQEYVESTGIYDWLGRLEEGRITKYISDGYLDIVSIPIDYAENIDEDSLGTKELNIY